MENISAVIFVTKEDLNLLTKAVTSLQGLASEIVVINMTEGEDLKFLSEKPGIKIYPHKKVPYVELVRNFGVSKATKDWILIVDPDEEIPDTLAAKLKEIVKKGKADYYRLPRKNIVFGKWMKYSRWWPDFNIRFFKKGKITWNEIIHSVPMTTGRGEDLPSEEKYCIIHSNYFSLSNYFEKMERYTTAQAKVLTEKNYKFIWKDLIKKPLAEFLSRFFAFEGYKDGIHGLALALLQAFSELVVYLKLWEKEKFMPQAISLKEVETQFKESEREISWWILESKIKEGNIFQSLILKLKRKILIKDDKKA